jgi:hypothetical protein
MKKALFLLGGVALLCGCSTTPTYWTKADFNKQQFDADWYQCQKENTPEKEYYWIVDAQMAAQCMRARGYLETDKK